MKTDRRQFLERIALGTAALAGAAPASALAAATHHPRSPRSGSWDVSWAQRLTARHKAVFDVPEIESGFGVWRVTIWQKQYQDVMGVPANDVAAVLVLRHNAIHLAMSHDYWERYRIGKKLKVVHPLTEKPVTRNPVLFAASRGEIAADFEGFMLDKVLERGVTVLACDLALQFAAGGIQKKDGGTKEAAYEKAKGFILPGVIMQPSGVFASLLAQESGALYIRAS